MDRIQTKKIIFKVKKIDKNQSLLLNNIQFTINSEDTLTAVYEKKLHKFEDILTFLKKNNIEILDITTEDGDLEDVFIQLTNN